MGQSWINYRHYVKTIQVCGSQRTLAHRTQSSPSLLGYDLKQLFIGAEGTLGVITGVSILAAPAPIASSNVMLALPRFENVLPLFKETKRQLSEILSAFEFIDRQAYELAVKHGQGRALNDEDVDGAECFVLVETSGGNREHDEAVCTNAALPSLSDDWTDSGAEIDRPTGDSARFRLAPHQHWCLGTVACPIFIIVGDS